MFGKKNAISMGYGDFPKIVAHVQQICARFKKPVLLVGDRGSYGKGDISISETSLMVILTDLQIDVPDIHYRYAG